MPAEGRGAGGPAGELSAASGRVSWRPPEGLGREQHRRQRERHGPRPRDEGAPHSRALHAGPAAHTCACVPGFPSLILTFLFLAGHRAVEPPLRSLESLLPSSYHGLSPTASFSLNVPG